MSCTCCNVVVTVDKLPMSDDDQAPMPSAPPSNTMDFIQGYSDIPMDDGRYECRLCIVLHGLY